MNSRQKLSSFLHPGENSQKIIKPNDSTSKTSFFSRKSPNIMEILDSKAIFHDSDLSIRRNTFKTFIKADEKSSIFIENYQKKRFFLGLREHTSQFNCKIFKKKLEDLFKTEKKLGIMHSNELWSDRDYRRLMNDSGLKPKLDYVKLNKKIKLFNEIVQELSAKFRESRKNHLQFQRENAIIDSFRKSYGQMEKISGNLLGKPDNSQEIIEFFQENCEKTTKITSFHESPDQMKELANEKIKRCDTESKTSLEKVRVFRNKLLQTVLEKRHQRDSLKKIPVSFQKSDNFKKKNPENKQRVKKIYEDDREKKKNFEVLKTCEDEKNSNRALKK